MIASRGRMWMPRVGDILIGALVLVVPAGMVATPAEAASTCSSSGGVVSIALSDEGASARVVVGTGADAGRILFGLGSVAPEPCGVATVGNTDMVVVTGGAGSQSIRVSLAGGPMAPGATTEPAGEPEIEFTVDLGDGDDEVLVGGAAEGDRIVAGSDGINLNAAEEPDDVDVTVENVETLALEGNAGGDTLSGAGGDGSGDVVAWARLFLRGGDGADTLTGGSANDVLNGGPGADALDGGAGIDTASYFGAPAAVIVSLAAGTASGGYGEDSLRRLENLTGSAFDDALTGDAGDNALNGMGGADILEGLGGIDSARYMLASAGVTVDLTAGTATGGAGRDTLSGIENALGSDFDDVLVGDLLENHLFGGTGADSLSGGEGNDFLQGGAGADRMRGGVGNDALAGRGSSDELRGGAGNDRLRGEGGPTPCTGAPATISSAEVHRSTPASGVQGRTGSTASDRRQRVVVSGPPRTGRST